MKKVSLLVLMGMMSSVVSADVIYSNDPSDPEIQFSYPLMKSKELQIRSGDGFNKETGRFEFKKPDVVNLLDQDYNKEVYGKVDNAVFGDKLILTIAKSGISGEIVEIESKTIPLTDRIFDFGGKFVRFIAALLPVIIPATIGPEPSAPEVKPNMTEDDIKLNEAQCIKHTNKISIVPPSTLPIEGQVVEIEGNNGKKCIEVIYKPISASSIPFSDLKQKNVGNNLLSSTCREVEITIHQTDSTKYNYTHHIVDPNFLTKSQIPENGILVPNACNWRIKK
ncbi:hypothetical protein ACFODO_20610 [Acinetobacter sichuanensis]|uniref:Uncharacterized protein n=1 Tax=Acinetobacter sichuanensis TaxID=2136183 RepID=A0A371YJG5_9GAMM|nr:hypothetical protein [Acinetobacter sichuanensis]RFC81613.1 hypothetical protein C9E89_020915 [Acinetobacter sichuanensis]